MQTTIVKGGINKTEIDNKINNNIFNEKSECSSK